MTDQNIRVGVGVLVFKDGQVLLSKRKGSHGAGEYASPGGHLEFGESFEECARRECREEAGIEIKNIKFVRLANIKDYPGRPASQARALRAGKHYVDIGLMAQWKSGNPQVLEPNKTEEWGWYDLDKLPKPMFQTIDSYLEALRSGRNYFDE